MWLTFKRPSKDWKDAPVYFFELGPDMLRYGLGYYSANKPTMDLFRHTLQRQPQQFLAAAACCRPPFELVGRVTSVRWSKARRRRLPTGISANPSR